MKTIYNIFTAVSKVKTVTVSAIYMKQSWALAQEFHFKVSILISYNV